MVMMTIMLINCCLPNVLHMYSMSLCIGTLITIRGTKMGIPEIGICTSRIPNIKMGIAATHMIFFFSWESEVLGIELRPRSAPTNRNTTRERPHE